MENLSEKEIQSLLNERNCGHYCIHCKHKKKVGRKLYCDQRKSNWSPVGYRIIRAHDDACGMYELKD